MTKGEKNPIPQVVYLINIKFIQIHSQFKMLEMKDLKLHFYCVFLEKTISWEDFISLETNNHLFASRTDTD